MITADTKPKKYILQIMEVNTGFKLAIKRTYRTTGKCSKREGSEYCCPGISTFF